MEKIAKTNAGINRIDDLIPEENDTVQLALKRLPPDEAYNRVFRIRRAMQVINKRVYSSSSQY